MTRFRSLKFMVETNEHPFYITFESSTIAGVNKLKVKGKLNFPDGGLTLTPSRNRLFAHEKLAFTTATSFFASQSQFCARRLWYGLQAPTTNSSPRF